MTIIEALRDRRLFGALPTFRDLTPWGAWCVLLKATYGLPLRSDEQEVFRRHTGQTTYAPPSGGWREAVAIVGRQSGKTEIASKIAAFEAVRASAASDGTELYAVLVAQDQRSALRTLLSRAKAPFTQVPALQQTVAKSITSSITLKNNVTLAAYPCRPEAVRGLRASVVVLDELAYYRSSEGFPLDTEMLRSVRPCLATTGGKLIILSSPYAQAGALWDLHRKHYGRDDATTLIWQGSAPQMNPLLPDDYLQQMERDDPEGFRSEVLGEFRSGVSTFLDPDAITACVASGIRERLPVVGVDYTAFCDPSGGRHDRFAVAIGHADGEDDVLDVVRAWSPPFDPSSVITEAADLLKRYHVTQVTGDRYAAEFVTEQFRHHDVTYTASSRDRSALYLELLPLINARRVVLLDLPDLLAELRGLQRRRGPGGRDRVDHVPGSKDDAANAVAGVLTAVAEPSRPLTFTFLDEPPVSQEEGRAAV